jgi:hypothetical protein
VLAKVLSAVLEIISDKADSVKPGSHGELRVFNLWLPAAGTLLGQGLMVPAIQVDVNLIKSFT